jgi:soluble lytic murein transglycosylase-like protein
VLGAAKPGRSATQHRQGRSRRIAGRASSAQAAQAARLQAALLQQLTHLPLQPVYTLYTVRPGDTVASIARRFHDVSWLIRRRNGGLWSMAPGDKITVWQWPFGKPYYATRTYLTDRPQFYTVVAGDTLDAIAGKLHTDAATLASQNGLGDANLIYAGQRLVLHHYTAHRQRVLMPGVPAGRLHTGLLLTDVANLVGVDAALVKGVAWHETAWTMKRGQSGEIGMMQILPSMARWVQGALVGYNLDPNVPENNALEGAILLAYYLDVTGRNTHKTLALYHSGDTRPDRRNGQYIRAVLRLRDYFYHHPRTGW